MLRRPGMDTIVLFERLGLAIAIGAIVGVERHWRDRDEKPGQRTAGLRTFTLCGMLGGLSGAIELYLNSPGRHTGLVIAGFFGIFSAVLALFEMREAISLRRYSVTSTVVGMTTFALGVLAVIGSQPFAVAGGVTLVALLASRHALHTFMRTLTWEELRSGIIFLAMIFVILPIIPGQRLKYFGGLSLSDIWTLVVLLTGISFTGYLALRIFGEKLGQILAGGLGGVISSTAVTLTNSRRSKQLSSCHDLVAGALAANSISLLKTLIMTGFLSFPSAIRLAPVLVTAALILATGSLFSARSTHNEPKFPTARSPFQLNEIFRLALLITAVTLAARVASVWLGHTGLISVAALSGLADTDAVIVSLAALPRQLEPDLAALVVGVAVITNTVAKCGFSVVLGSRRFSQYFSLFSLTALFVGIFIYFILS